jgi:BatD DUF11 like domain
MLRRTGRANLRRERRSLAGLAAACFVVLAVHGAAARAEIQVEAHLDREQVAIGEQVTLTVSVHGSGDANPPELPELPDFRVFPAGSSRNFSFVNGRMTSATVYSFILAAKREGTFEIPPVAVLDGGTRVTSRPLSLTVGPATPAPPAGAPPPGTPPRARRGRTGRSGRGNDPRAVFVTAAADPANVYAGEQVTLTVRFYQGVRLVERPDYRPPVATGFWTENLPGERTYYTQVEGRQYHVTELRTALFPTAPGQLTIGPATVHCVLEGNPFQDPFSLFGGFSASEPRTVESTPITIEVKPIPASGRPPNWAGAVGRFTLEARLEPPQVKVGEAATLVVVLAGQGNIRAVGDPKLPAMPGLRTFDSGSTIEDKKEGGSVGGVKKLTQVVVAEASGEYPIPPIEYAVFRPDLDRFEAIRSTPLKLTVLEGGVGEGGGAGTGSASLGGLAGGAAARGPNLRFIRLGDPELQRARAPLWTDFRFWLVQLVPIIGFAAALIAVRHRERVAGDLGYARHRRAGGEARRRLAAARRHLERGARREFHGAVSQALLGYIADRLNVPAPSLTSADLREQLERREIEPELVTALDDCLERCDRGRFAAELPGGEREVLAEAEDLFSRLARAGL